MSDELSAATMMRILQTAPLGFLFVLPRGCINWSRTVLICPKKAPLLFDGLPNICGTALLLNATSNWK